MILLKIKKKILFFSPISVSRLFLIRFSNFVFDPVRAGIVSGYFFKSDGLSAWLKSVVPGPYLKTNGELCNSVMQCAGAALKTESVGYVCRSVRVFMVRFVSVRTCAIVIR